MKFTTFAKLFFTGALAVVAFAVYLIFGAKHSAPSASVPAPVAVAVPVSVAVAPPVAVSEPAPSAQSVALTTGELRTQLEQWLNLHSNREGKDKIADILPNASFRASIVRFPDEVAKQWSSDPSQWSQIYIDLDRNGMDDEKWLLKNGAIYKREVLDANKKVIKTEYLK